MVTKEHVKETVDAFIRKILVVGSGEVNGDCLLRDDVGLDSIDISELIMMLSKQYNVNFTAQEEDFINDMTINQVVELVYSKCSKE